MALSLVSNFVQTPTFATTITSGTVSTAVGDLVVASFVAEDNNAAGTLSISNTGAAITWTNIATTNTVSNTKVAAWRGVVTTAGNITVTVTYASNSRASLCTDVYTGAHATTPVPAGNVFSGTNGTNISQSITPTSAGSMLRMVAGDWAATNTFAAIANVTLEQTFNQPGFYTSAFLKPTTQPLGAGAFTIGETDTSGTIAWIAFEIQAAGGAAPDQFMLSDEAQYADFTLPYYALLNEQFYNPNQTSSVINQFWLEGTPEGIDYLWFFGGYEVVTNTPWFDLSSPISGNTGVIASLLQDDTSALTGTQAATGTLASRLIDDKSSLTGTQTATGSIASILKDDTSSLTGTQGSTVTGTIVSRLRDDTSALTGVQTATGTIASRLKDDTSSLTGSQAATGSIASRLKDDLSALTGVQAATGTIASTLKDDTSSLIGSQSATVTGVIASRLVDDTSSLTGIQAATGAVNSKLKDDTSTLTGLQTATGSINSRLKDDTSSLTGLSGGAVNGFIASILKDDLSSLLGIAGIAPGHTGGDDAPHGIYWQDQPRREITRKPIDRLLDKSVKEFFEEVSHDKKLAKKARKIVKPYQKAQEIDWKSLNADLSRVQMLLDLYTEYLLGLDDEEIMILLLAMV